MFKIKLKFQIPAQFQFQIYTQIQTYIQIQVRTLSNICNFPGFMNLRPNKNRDEDDNSFS